MTVQESEPIKVRINPDNRRVRVDDPAYLDNWVRELEKARALFEKEIEIAAEKDELQIPVDPDDPLMNTTEKAIHRLAHAKAEEFMQRWAIKSGIGMLGINNAWDHGTSIEYIDDSSVPLFEHQIVKPEDQHH